MKAETLAYFEENFKKLKQLRQTSKGEVWLVSARDGSLVVWKNVRLAGLPYATLKEIQHPLLPEIFHVAEDEEQTLVIEEYVHGQPLSDLVARQKYLGEQEIRSILLQLCDGLALLHGNGIIHRDIKPSNIICQKNGAVRLIDFDAARIVKEDGEEDTNLLGTRGYAPPEQFGYGQTDARSDIYSLGVTLKKLLSPDYKGYLCRILDKCTEVDTKRRYDSVRHLERAVRCGRFWQAVRWWLAGVAAMIVIGTGIYVSWNHEKVPQVSTVEMQGTVGMPESKESGAPAEPESTPDTQVIQALETVPQNAVPNGSMPEVKTPASTEPEPATVPKEPPPAQNENRIYATVFYNGSELWVGRNTSDVPLNHLGTMLCISRDMWQEWQAEGSSEGLRAQFPETWNLTVHIRNASNAPWENPRLDLQYTDGVKTQESALYGNTLPAGEEMDFVVPLGDYQVEHPDVASPARDLKLRLSGDGTQQIFGSNFTVSFAFEQ